MLSSGIVRGLWFSLALLLSSVGAPKPDSVEIVAFSGGGIRAAIGAIVANQFLEDHFPDYKEVHGASGGAWGIGLNEFGDLSTVCASFKNQLAPATYYFSIIPSLTQTSHIQVGPRGSTKQRESIATWWANWLLGVSKFVPSTWSHPNQKTEWKFLDETFYATKKKRCIYTCSCCRCKSI